MRDVQAALKQHGCVVLKNVFTKKALAADVELKYTFVDIRNQFDTLDAIIKQEPEDVETGRFSMGYIVNKLNPGGTADALVFMRAYLGGSFFAEIVVVDARNGNIPYYVTVRDQRAKLVAKKPERLVTLIGKAFEQFPGSTKTN